MLTAKVMQTESNTKQKRSFFIAGVLFLVEWNCGYVCFVGLLDFFEARI